MRKVVSRWRFSTMRALSIALVLLMELCISSCSDVGFQPTAGPEPADGLTILTSSQLYHATDTVHLTILNLGSTQCQLSSCNSRLIYQLQIFAGNFWYDHDSINPGPCLAIYGPITLEPGQSLSEELALTTLRSIPIGKCRIRIEYVVLGQQGTQELYSSSFEITYLIENVNLTASFSLADTTGQVMTVFHPGQQFDMFFSVTNTTADTLTYWYTGFPVVFWIWKGDSLVASSVDGWAFPQDIHEGYVAPGGALQGFWRAPNTPAQNPKVVLVPGSYQASVSFPSLYRSMIEQVQVNPLSPIIFRIVQ